MAWRFSDNTTMGRKWINAARLFLAPLVLLGIALMSTACGGDPETSTSVDSVVAQAPASQDHEQHLRDLEVQLESLERQSEAMRREVLSRLDQIDVTREALSVQLMSLRGETPEPAEDAAVTASAAAPVATTVASPESETVASSANASRKPSKAAPAQSNPFLRFLLLIFILAAIFFLARIFFDRWGDPEDGERPPSVEATTDLGKIRFPPGTEAHPEEGDEIELGDPDDSDEGRPGD
jgi:hypothetical protein